MTYKERLELYYRSREKLQELAKIETSADYDLSELIRRGNWREHEDEISSARARRKASFVFM